MSTGRRRAVRFLVLPAALLALVVGLGAPGSSAQPASGNAALPIRLYGVVEQERGGVALLRFGEARPVALRPDESHRGFVVRQVFGDRVRLEAPDGRVLDVGLPAASRASAHPPVPETPRESDLASPEPLPGPVAPPEPPAGDPTSATVPPDRGGTRLSRDEVRLRLQTELPRILASAVVAPRLLGTEVVGLELVAFPMDTVLGQTGLVPGDVLLAVNGRQVRGAESLAVLVQRFQTASRVEITVERDGAVFPLRLEIE